MTYQSAVAPHKESCEVGYCETIYTVGLEGKVSDKIFQL